MNYQTKLQLAEQILRSVKDNLENCRLEDQNRSIHTDGQISGLSAAMQAGGMNVSYGSYFDGSNCLHAASLSIEGIAVLENEKLCIENIKLLKKALIPHSEISIYQINTQRDGYNVAFINRKHLEHLQGTAEVNSSIYDRVYSCSLPITELDDVYKTFNLDLPNDFRGRSLSVSDVVEIHKSPILKEGFYFCDSIGFSEITFDASQARNQEDILQPVKSSVPLKSPSPKHLTRKRLMER